jgi:hypothetical protein
VARKVKAKVTITTAGTDGERATAEPLTVRGKRRR